MYKHWNLPSREGNPATYLACHFAELPLKKEGPGLNSAHPFHIPLNFCFDRKVANVATSPPRLREEPFLYPPSEQGLAVSLPLNQVKRAGAGPGYGRKASSTVSGKEGRPSSPFPSAEVTSSQSINGLQSAAGGRPFSRDTIMGPRVAPSPHPSCR